MLTGLRLVSGERLSRLRDNSVGIERREDAAERFAAAYDHTIIAYAPDTDVSGNVPMWERPEVGPWVNDPAKQMLYDGFIFSNIDRLGRNARHISAMRDWAEDHGKTLIIVDPPLMWPPAENDMAGPIVWDILSRLAEAELKAITKRNRETLAYLKANKFLSGRWPFGYQVAAIGKRKTLVPDEDQAPVVQEIFARRERGETIRSIVDWLNESEVTSPLALYAVARGDTPKTMKWNKNTVINIIHNPIYRGVQVDSAGNVILNVPEIIDPATWYKVQKIHDEAGQRNLGRTATEKAVLLGVIKCGACGRNMHRMPLKGSKLPDGSWSTYPAYYCQGAETDKHRGISVNLADAEAYLSEQVKAYGDEPHFVMVANPGDIHVDEIKTVENQLRSLDFDDPDFDSKQASLRGERQRLIKLDEESKTEFLDWVPAKNLDGSVKTVADMWAETEGDNAARRKFLLDRGCELHVMRERGRDQETGKSYNRVQFSIGWRSWWAGQPKAARADGSD